MTQATDPAAARRFAAQCLQALDADPRFYTTSDAVLDLEAVRVAIGAEQLNLVGISYGTRVALEYLRRHPARRAQRDPRRRSCRRNSRSARSTRAISRSRSMRSSSVAPPMQCARSASARRGLALAALLDALDHHPQSVRYRDPLTDEWQDGTLTRDVVAGVVRLFAYVPQLSAMLPQSLAEAAAGRSDVLMAQGRMIESLVGEQINQGLQLSVSCSEDADRLHVDPADASTLHGHDLRRDAARAVRGVAARPSPGGFQRTCAERPTGAAAVRRVRSRDAAALR